MNLRTIQPEELTEREIRVLYSITLRGISGLRQNFREVTSYLRERHIPGRIRGINAVIIMAEENGQINGWGMITWHGDQTYRDLQLNVRRSHRRNGIGKAIVEKAIEYCQMNKMQRPTVTMWDTRSTKFYKQFGDRVRVNAF